MIKSSYFQAKSNLFKENEDSENLSCCKAELTSFKRKALLFKAANKGSPEDIELIK